PRTFEWGSDHSKETCHRLGNKKLFNVIPMNPKRKEGNPTKG
ncbi:hypothetical protein NPIL_117981, partial [Nephila pilipes]